MLATASVILVFVVLVALLTLAVRKQRLTLSGYHDYGEPFSDDDDSASGVREPRRPPPTSGAAAAVAEPDEDAA